MRTALVVAVPEAEPLVGAARSHAGQQRALAAGADAVVELDTDDVDELAARLGAAVDGPVDLVLDPLFGVGFGQYEYVSPRFVGNSFATSAHNQYLKILAEQGILGTLLYVAAAAALLIAMRRSGSPWRQTAIAAGRDPRQTGRCAHSGRRPDTGRVSPSTAVRSSSGGVGIRRTCPSSGATRRRSPR